MSNIKYLVADTIKKTHFYCLNVTSKNPYWIFYGGAKLGWDTEEMCIRIPNQSYKDEALLLLSLGMEKDEIEEILNAKANSN